MFIYLLDSVIFHLMIHNFVRYIYNIIYLNNKEYYYLLVSKYIRFYSIINLNIRKESDGVSMKLNLVFRKKINLFKIIYRRVVESLLSYHHFRLFLDFSTHCRSAGRWCCLLSFEFHGLYLEAYAPCEEGAVESSYVMY